MATVIYGGIGSKARERHTTLRQLECHSFGEESDVSYED